MTYVKKNHIAWRINKQYECFSHTEKKYQEMIKNEMPKGEKLPFLNPWVHQTRTKDHHKFQHHKKCKAFPPSLFILKQYWMFGKMYRLWWPFMEINQFGRRKNLSYLLPMGKRNRENIFWYSFIVSFLWIFVTVFDIYCWSFWYEKFGGCASTSALLQ